VRNIIKLFSIVSVIVFILIVILFHMISSNYPPLQFGISYYVFSKNGLWMGIGFMIVGIAGIIQGLRFWRLGATSISRLGASLLILWGLMSIVAGIFPLDTPDTKMTFSGILHNVAGRNPILILPAVLFIEIASIRKINRRDRIILNLYWFWLMLAALVLLFLFGSLLEFVNLVGLFQRIYWACLLIWLLSLINREI
jgi:hypothetical protein